MYFKIENFGQKLKEARKKNKISRAQMAKKLNMTPQAYGAYELGKREPPVSKLINICEFLHVSPHDLLGYESDTNDELERTIRDIQECGFLVFPDNRTHKRIINILNEAESNSPSDEVYTIDGKTLINLSKKINSMAMNTYRESKYQLYKLAFDEVQKIQIQAAYDWLKTDQAKPLRNQIIKNNPHFFDKDNIDDEDATDNNAQENLYHIPTWGQRLEKDGPMIINGFCYRIEKGQIIKTPVKDVKMKNGKLAAILEDGETLLVNGVSSYTNKASKE